VEGLNWSSILHAMGVCGEDDDKISGNILLLKWATVKFTKYAKRVVWTATAFVTISALEEWELIPWQWFLTGRVYQLIVL